MDVPILQLDLTPYVRAPHSGVGRTAFFSFRALGQVSKKRALVLPVSRSGGLGRARRLGRFRGAPTLYHGFEHKMPRTFGIGRIVTVHDLWTLDPNPFQSKTYQRLQRRHLLSAIRSCDAIATPSQAVRNELVQRFPELEDQVHAVPHGWQLNPSLSQITDPKVRAFLESSEPFALSIGCLEVRKNQQTLLEAFRHCRGRLALVGSLGFGHEKILNQLALHPKRSSILHLNRATDSELSVLMKRASVYVQASLAEGFGMPVLDAMHFGKFVVASDIPVFREILGSGGTFLPPLDTKGWTAVIEDAYCHERSAPELSLRAKPMTWDLAARSLMGVYDSVLSTINSQSRRPFGWRKTSPISGVNISPG